MYVCIESAFCSGVAKISNYPCLRRLALLKP